MTTPPHPSWPPEQERGPGTTPYPPPYTADAATPGVQPGPPPGYPGYPGAYGYPGYLGYPVQRPTNGFAIASLVLGIVWIWWIGSVLALIFGYVARKQIRKRGEGGDGLAIAGIVLGWVGVGVFAIFFIIGFIGGFSGAF